MKRAALYCRVSTDEQARHGYSIGAQLEALRRYAKEHGYVIVGEHLDEGISGQKGYKKRPAMTELMQALDRVDVILFIRLDRWFRSVKLFYQVQDLLDAHGVGWIATQEDYETVTAGGRFKVNIMLSVAQNEAERTGERIRFVFDAKRAKGEVCSGRIPLGYRIEDKHLVPDPETAPIAQDMFRRMVELRSVSRVRDYMADTYGIVHTYKPMKYILQNRRYLGGEWHEGIIDQETFRRVQEILNARSVRHSSTGNVFLFGGMVHCRECGRRMKSGKPNTINYYYCANHSEYGDIKCQANKRNREDVIESFLLEHLVDTAEAYNAEIYKKAPPKKDPDKIRRKMEKLKDLYLDDLIDRAIYERDYKALEMQLAETDIVPLCTPLNIEELAGSLAMYAELSRDAKKAFWSRILKRIEISIDGEIFLILN